jgi:hypothetical protein
LRNNFILLITVAASFLFSCGNGKEVSTVDPLAPDPVDVPIEEVDLAIFGVVRDFSKTEGCGFLIEINDESGSRLLEPLELGDEFKIDGLDVLLQFTPSRRASTCSKASMPVTLDFIEKK